MNSNSKISTVTTLKAPLEETLSFVHYHLNIGIDHMYLFFDDPEDEAIPYITELEKATVIPCNEEHWNKMGVNPGAEVQIKQEANATFAFHFARNSGFEWIIHMDSDELIYNNTSIKDYFRQISEEVDVIRFPVMEATPQKEEYKNAFKEINHFKVFTALPTQTKNFSTDQTEIKRQKLTARIWYNKKRLAKYLGSKSASKQKFLYGHEVGKSATRTSAAIRKISCHIPVPENNTDPRLIVSKSIFVLHYDCMGFKKWKSKWHNRIFGDQIFATQRFSSSRLKMREEIKDTIGNENKLLAFYLDMYHLSNYEFKLLKSLGLLRIINFEDQLFEKLE